jgi:hypothetical protein
MISKNNGILASSFFLFNEWLRVCCFMSNGMGIKAIKRTPKTHEMTQINPYVPRAGVSSPAREHR